jgi:hypothetical protein
MQPAWRSSSSAWFNEPCTMMPSFIARTHAASMQLAVTLSLEKGTSPRLPCAIRRAWLGSPLVTPSVAYLTPGSVPFQPGKRSVSLMNVSASSDDTIAATEAALARLRSAIAASITTDVLGRRAADRPRRRLAAIVCGKCIKPSMTPAAVTHAAASSRQRVPYAGKGRCDASLRSQTLQRS